VGGGGGGGGGQGRGVSSRQAAHSGAPLGYFGAKMQKLAPLLQSVKAKLEKSTVVLPKSKWNTDSDEEGKGEGEGARRRTCLGPRRKCRGKGPLRKG